MTVNTSENKAENALPQDKVDTSLSQPKVDTNLSQNKTDQKPQEEVHEDQNWKAFREGRKKDLEERKAAEKRAAEKEAEIAALKAAMEAAFSKNNPPQNYQQNAYQEEETEDQKIERKIEEGIRKREAISEQQRREREQQEYPQKLRRDFPDFNQVVTEENLEYLEYKYPKLVRPLQRLSDDYEKWADIYHLVKEFIPNNATAKKDSARAESNNNKPKSISSPGLSQTGEAMASSGRLTDDRKEANWQRMQKLLKGIS